MQIPIYFFYQDIQLTLTNRIQLKKFILKIFKTEKRSLKSLNYIFCSDDYLLSINKKYLKHDYFTDIISFEMALTGQPSMGEIYISVDRVRDNVQKQGVTTKEEIHRVIFHGALHLCGYKDKSLSDKKLMKALEDKYLKLYFK